MKFFPVPERLVAYLIGFILILFSLIPFSQSQLITSFSADARRHVEYCISHKESQEYQNSKDCQSFLYKATDDPVALFTGGLLVFTMLLAGFTYRLFLVTRDGVADQSAATREALKHADRSARAAEATLDKGQSPYLYPAFKLVSPKEIDPNADVNVFADFVSAEFTNYGQSPAFIESVDLQFIEGGKPHQIVVNLGISWFDPTVMVVKENATERLTVFEIEKERVESSEISILAGYIRYRDLTGDQYLMPIRYGLFYKMRSFIPLGTLRENKRYKLTEEQIERGDPITF